MAVDSINEFLDLFARRIAGTSSIFADSVQHAFNQLHRISAIELVQFAAVVRGVKRHRQRLAAGEDEARVASFQQPFT